MKKTTIAIILVGIIVNISIIKILILFNPPSQFRGPRGERGIQGKIGFQGVVGKKGPRNSNANKVGPTGQSGRQGNPASCNFNASECVGEGRHDWEDMNLMSYNASKKGCLFGYRHARMGARRICQSPARGNTPATQSPSDDTELGLWGTGASASDINCSYDFNRIKSYCPDKFEKFAKILSARDCPGIPVGGKVLIPPEYKWPPRCQSQ